MPACIQSALWVVASRSRQLVLGCVRWPPLDLLLDHSDVDIMATFHPQWVTYRPPSRTRRALLVLCPWGERSRLTSWSCFTRAHWVTCGPVYIKAWMRHTLCNLGEGIRCYGCFIDRDTSLNTTVVRLKFVLSSVVCLAVKGIGCLSFAMGWVTILDGIYRACILLWLYVSVDP